METTRIESVMAEVRRRIGARTLVAGARLPSVRSFAKIMGVSVSTVVEAYGRLAAEGAIQSRPGSGFYVANASAPFALAASGPRLDRVIDPFWVSRQSLEAAPDALRPGCGWLPPSWLPQDAIRRALRTLARADGVSLCEYGTPLGLAPLRGLIARRLADRGVEAGPDQIMLTESGTQAIDLLCRLLLEPGDTVLVDDPCYFNFHALLRAHRARLVSVPYLTNGPDIEAFGAALAQHKPRLYITNSGIHNPTGASLSSAVAHRVLKLAEIHGLTIIEDDIFADLEISPAPRLAAFDGLERVVEIGSFSKILSAAFRCGFVAARPDWIEGLTDLKIATSFGGGRIDAELTQAVLGDGSYRKHLDVLRHRLAQARHMVSQRLGELGITPQLAPQAGMFLWCTLPDGHDAADIARSALAHNVVLAPGNVFSLSQTATSALRFNVSQTLDDRIYAVLGAALNGR